MTTPPTFLTRIRTWLRSDMKVLRWVFLALYIALIAGLSTPFFLNTGDTGWLWAILASSTACSECGSTIPEASL